MSTKYKQGIFHPKFKNKYKGNKQPVFRSGWEKHFFNWCDNNPNVLEWASESIIIPYISPIDNKVHRYYVDNSVIIKEGTKIVKYLIEIKPKKQTIIPKHTKYKKRNTILYENAMYVVNQAKWQSAEKWCKKHGYKFLILTEKELFSKK